MHPGVLPYLRCPICGGGFTEARAGSGRALGCPSGHSFDIARQGYVNLQRKAPVHSGDTAGMVSARVKFLAAGHYKFIAAAIARAACTSRVDGHAERGSRLIADAGAGTGYYLHAVLEALPDFTGLALDVSKAALRRAARIHPRAAAALSDTWQQLPLMDGAVRIILNLFAPRNGAEFRRVLAADGTLIVVTPAGNHLSELVGALRLLSVDPEKDQAVAASLGEAFDLITEERLEQSLRLKHADIENLVAMGPSSWHIEPAKLAPGIARLPDVVTVTASVRIASYRPGGT